MFFIKVPLKLKNKYTWEGRQGSEYLCSIQHFPILYPTPTGLTALTIEIIHCKSEGHDFDMSPLFGYRKELNQVMLSLRYFFSFTSLLAVGVGVTVGCYAAKSCCRKHNLTYIKWRLRAWSMFFFVIRPFFPNTLSEGEEFLVIYVIFHFLFLVWKLFKILQDLQMRMMCRSAYSYS